VADQRTHLGGRLLVVGAAALWGTTGTAQHFAPKGADSLSLGTVRIVIGGIALALIAPKVRVPWRAQWRASFAGAVCVAVYQLSFFVAVRRTGVAVGTIVALGSAPVFAGLLDWRRTGHVPSRRWAAASMLAVIGGSVLIASRGSLSVDSGGVLLALLAGLGYSIYTLAGKHLVEAGWPSGVVMAIHFVGGAILMVPILFFEPLHWLLTTRGVAVELHLGLMTTAVAYMMFGRALRTTSVGTVATLSLAEPLTATLLGLFLLHEHINAAGIAGCAILALGLVTAARVRPTVRASRTPAR
jgi:DME family drug/metabolite transporter